MELWENISSSRQGFGVHFGVRNQSFDSPELLAGEFGLRTTPYIYFEISEPTALAILQKLLHEDMAYNSELMSSAEALAIAYAFLDLFRQQDVRYFSNGHWHLPPNRINPSVTVHPGWTPATDATFDGGILAIASDISGCAWFEDED